MRILLLLSLVGLHFALTGCTSTHLVSAGPQLGDDSSEDLIGETRHTSVILLLKDGNALGASNVRVQGDSLFSNNSDDGREQVFGVSEIRLIRRVDHFRGALEGLGLGFVSGLAVGFAYAYTFGQGDKDIPAFLMLVGSPPLGAVIGGILGHKHEYILIK